MKIFKFRKEKDYKAHDKVIELNLDREKEFKYITITNPIDSNRLYIINNIMLNNINKNNELCFYGYENNKNIENNNKHGFLDIKSKIYEGDNKDKLLLYKSKVNNNNNLSLLGEDYFIVLPGGTLSIEFSNYDKDLSVRLALEEEEIQWIWNKNKLYKGFKAIWLLKYKEYFTRAYSFLSISHSSLIKLFYIKNYGYNFKWKYYMI